MDGLAKSEQPAGSKFDIVIKKENAKMDWTDNDADNDGHSIGAEWSQKSRTCNPPPLPENYSNLGSGEM